MENNKASEVKSFKSGEEFSSFVPNYGDRILKDFHVVTRCCLNKPQELENLILH